MFKLVFSISTLLVLLFIQSCKTEAIDANGIKADQSPITDTTFLEVLVSNLRMRSEPNLTSETKMMLPEGAKVQFWDEKSETKSQIALRGQTMNDYWYLVKYGKEIGWVFAGGLKSVQKKDAFDQIVIPGERVGPIKASDTEQSIIDRIGGEQVERGEFVISDQQSVAATYVFPSSENELILLWDQADFKRLREIRIRKIGSKWKLASGIGIGSTLKEVAAANNGPFVLSGFNWEYAGTTLNWQSGTLPEKLTLIFEAPTKIHKTLVGDHNILSDESHMARANPKVKVMRIMF